MGHPVRASLHRTVLYSTVLCCIALCCTLQRCVMCVAGAPLQVLIWEIGRMPRDRLPCLSGSVKLQPGVLRPLGRPAVTVNFRVVGAAVSGLRIESVGVKNETYFVHKGYKSCTQAARYQVRT